MEKLTFADFDLPVKILDVLADMELFEPTPIQEKSIKPILSGRDVMGIAQTGTGKTLAYLLPVLKTWKYNKAGNPTVLVLVPTRELVVQVAEILEKLTVNTTARVIGIYGGKNINTQKLLFNDGCDILVGTPGRVMDLSIDNAISLKEVQRLIIDEFDEMLNLGFRPQLTHIFEMMREKRQNILFSATMTEAVDVMLDEYFASPIEISLAKSGTPLEKIEQTAYKVENFNTKINLLEHLLKTKTDMSKVLIFNNNKRHADLLFTKIDELFPGQFDVIHSNKSQNYRLKAMKSFENEEIRGLITTDVMARGLDISNITHVINFETPDIPEQYIHRIGRTGRADKDGKAITFVTKKEEPLILDIELLMDKELIFNDFPEGVKINPAKIASEKDEVIMKNPVQVKLNEGGGAFHEKKDKNKKENWGGPSKRKEPKKFGANRAQQKAISKSKRKK
ncbi:MULTISPECIES: DEAD/DEAH box helicase [Chryseobacterium]|jgi:ATP-dependent RNA helicase RhlE|uniref:ATP-dependent RNA helicase RhlE n=1 Tax=Chryseobacterium rhizosphaerae TaxID=395937 RepID=A0AAE4C0X7_9FLAO|nr:MULTISPECIES: DEAD/DEAH box helicase [Chryseobacterium]MBL3546085.1 DEAD/DEAH box helicase [Chryseobacterium sp. KMC2]MDC8100837.1 DEAD/DEAH box helicase [Chryseobacterium rhizosphaerae]MDR6525871.1 ATP-dependent RNA helicase RhlE [Chryseobacterium rhizosphaerae]MDR6544944.1 ATP-dependent RNA helicase RhlE [Chryseobacterium rhizosphaerae]REC77278.1 ATP-dependent helicase [Chryseobacterium rhizosphaerae]